MTKTLRDFNTSSTRFGFYLIAILLCTWGAFKASIWLDTTLTGLQGGQVLQGGTFWRALTLSFKDADYPDQSLQVDQLRFKNVDRFLPITVISTTGKQDSTYYSKTQDKWVELGATRLDSLVIRTQNTSHSAVIDDITFQRNGRSYHIDFDQTPEGDPVAVNTQLLEYRIDDVLVQFKADNAVPTVIRGADLSAVVGLYIAKISGPLSTLLILSLFALICWMLFRFIQVMSHDLDAAHFYTEQDEQTVQHHGQKIFQNGQFSPEGRDYTLCKTTQLYGILSSIDPQIASNPTRLITSYTHKVETFFDDLENRLLEIFGIVGIVSLSLGLLGTVVGMIEAFRMLEDAMKVGEGPAQTQLKMAHYINFALVTTAIGFLGRIFSLILMRKITTRILQIRDHLLTFLPHLQPVNNKEPLPPVSDQVHTNPVMTP